MKRILLFFVLILTPALSLADTSETSIDGKSDLQVRKQSIYFIERPSNPTTPAANAGKIFAKDAAGTTTLYFIDSSGTVTNLLSGTSSDIASIGDCASGACFDGTQGTTLTFNHAGGDKTLDYDGTDFLFNAPLDVTGALDISTTIEAGSGNITLTDATGNLDGTKIANADLGQVSFSSGVATVEDVTCTNCLTDTEVASADLATTVTTNANLTGEVTSSGNATTIADSVTVTGWVLGTSSATTLTAGTINVDLLDAVGAVDMDYGSADVTDHTFITDGTTDADFVVPLTSIGGAEIVSGDLTAVQLGTDSVSADELNATGVEAELESALDIAGDCDSTGMGSVVCDAASTTADGFVEIAIASEVDTGTDTGRAISPDALAGSNLGEKVVQIIAFDFTTNTATGDGKGYFVVPSSMTGMDLVEVSATVITAGTTNTTDIQIANVTQAADILSTKMTIDSAETSTSTAATPAVISATEDDVTTNDVLRIDVDAVSTTPAKGLIVTLIFRLP